MKAKVFTVLLFFIIVTASTIISCTKCGDNTIYKVVDMYIEQTGVQYNANNQPPDKLYYYRIYNDSIYYSFYGIYMEPNFQARAIVPKFELITSAYACDPVPSSTNDRITDITITADQDFDDSHAKGENLAEYFDIVVTYKHTDTYQEIRDLKTYLAKKPIVPDKMVLILNTKPKKDTRLRFKVQYKQEGVRFDSIGVVFDPITLLQ